MLGALRAREAAEQEELDLLFHGARAGAGAELKGCSMGSNCPFLLPFNRKNCLSCLLEKARLRFFLEMLFCVDFFLIATV